ncbi:MAG: protease inhibitor I42 family protein [Alphaproteobacteria bacterium]|nr:protease inhibitor I42 family protein [Alphaproteobacteria bacterium]MBQ8677911.1 protease inhibitor I42 family protein [Alphaproteobacteria bacterium]
MKKLFYFFIFVLMGCTPDAETVLTEQNDGQLSETSVNAKITIRLNGNATTGYSWNFSSDSPAAYMVLKDEYEPQPHPQEMVGTGGQSVYQIKLLQEGNFTITARYYRPWEEFNPEKDKQFLFPIEVK